jgi:outer membrane protein TolC
MSSIPLSGQTTFTLEEAISYAIKNSNQIRLSQLDLAEAEAQIKEYWAIGLPRVTARADYSYYFEIPTQIIPDFITPAIDNRLIEYETVTERVGILDSDEKTLPLPGGDQGVPAQFGTDHFMAYGIDMETMLFDGSFIVGLQAQKLYKEQVSNQVRLTERDVRVEVVKAYVNVLVAKVNLEIVQNDIKTLNDFFYETEKIYEEGFSEKLDVDRIELSLTNLEATKTTLERLIQSSKNLLKYYMNYPVEQELTLTSTLEELLVDQQPIDPEDVDYAYEDRIEYKILEQGEELNGLNIRREKARFLPTLYGFAGYERQLLTNQLFNSGVNWFPTSAAGVNLAIPIYTGDDRTAKIQKARIGLDRVQTQKRDFEQAMDLEVRTAATEYENSRLIVEARKQSLDITQDIYDTVLTKYREGVGSSLEVNQAEQDLFRAQGNYTTALFDLLNAKIDLDKALGIL